MLQVLYGKWKRSASSPMLGLLVGWHAQHTQLQQQKQQARLSQNCNQLPQPHDTPSAADLAQGRQQPLLLPAVLHPMLLVACQVGAHSSSVLQLVILQQQQRQQQVMRMQGLPLRWRGCPASQWRARCCSSWWA
jgi:hypothetical protein